jgi:transposase
MDHQTPTSTLMNAGPPNGVPSTIAEVAADFDISPESVRRWLRQADIDDGVTDGLTTAEQAEIVRLRRANRRLEMENEILRRAAAYFAKDQLPK